MKKKYSDLISNIYAELPKNKVFTEDMNNYSRCLTVLADEIVYEFTKNDEIRRMLIEYIQKVIRKYVREENVNCDIKKELIQYISYTVSRKRRTGDNIVKRLFQKKYCSEGEIEILTRIL